MICPLMSKPVTYEYYIEDSNQLDGRHVQGIKPFFIDCQKENCAAWNKILKNDIKCMYFQGYRNVEANVTNHY